MQHAVSFEDSKPPDEPGFEWVRHNDHWDRVPIDGQIAEVSDGSSQLASVDAAYIRSLVLDTLQKTEQELTESQRDQLKRALDYVQQNGITKAQLEQLKQSLEREVIYDARAAAEKAEHARNHARNVAYHNYYYSLDNLSAVQDLLRNC